jgi:hypothetical protein
LSSPHQSHCYAFPVASGSLCSLYSDRSYVLIFVKLYLLRRGALIFLHTYYYKQLHQQLSQRLSCTFHLTTPPVRNSMSAFPWLWQFWSGRFRCSHSFSTAGKTRPTFTAAEFRLYQICRLMLLLILWIFFMFEFPCIISLHYIKNQQGATLAVLFISHCMVTLHVSDAFCVHHQEYSSGNRPWTSLLNIYHPDP